MLDYSTEISKLIKKLVYIVHNCEGILNNINYNNLDYVWHVYNMYYIYFIFCDRHHIPVCNDEIIE